MGVPLGGGGHREGLGQVKGRRQIGVSVCLFDMVPPALNGPFHHHQSCCFVQ